MEAVRHLFNNDVHASTRRTALALDMSRTTVWRILKHLKFHPYKVQIVQKLYNEDLASRLDFAATELDRIRLDPTHLVRILFSDEAHFHLDGGVNRHNHRYWSQENPRWISEQGLHSPRTTVWAAIGEPGVIGPFFFDENVNSERYLDMLQNFFWPKVLERNLEQELIFMQDGAPPHWGRNVRNWLELSWSVDGPRFAEHGMAATISGPDPMRYLFGGIYQVEGLFCSIR